MFDGVGISFGFSFGFDDAPTRKKKGGSPKQPKSYYADSSSSEPYRRYGETRPGENICWNYGPDRPPSTAGTDSLSSSPGKSEKSFGAGSPPKAPQPQPPAPQDKAQSKPTTAAEQPPAPPAEIDPK